MYIRTKNFTSFSVVIVAILILTKIVNAATPTPSLDTVPDEAQHTINLSAISCLTRTTPEATPSGYVDYVVSSWKDSPGEGENKTITLEYQIEMNDGFVSGYMLHQTGQFTRTANYRFGSTIYLSGEIKRITLIATAKSVWGDGHKPGQLTGLDILLSGCDGTTGIPGEGEPLKPRVFLANLQR